MKAWNNNNERTSGRTGGQAGGQTDGHTDGRTDGGTRGRTDGRAGNISIWCIIVAAAATEATEQLVGHTAFWMKRCTRLPLIYHVNMTSL